VDIKRIVMAGGVLATAGAIGFVMQNGEAAKARYAQAPVANVTSPDISGTASDPLEVTGIELTSSDAGSQIAPKPNAMSLAATMPAKKDDFVEDAVRTAGLGDINISDVETTDPAAPASLCNIEFLAQASAAAMVELSLNAECYPNERVTFHHSGMMFTEATDSDGKLFVKVPALADNAVFIVAFANGEGALANAEVSSLEFYDRMVVQSKANGALHINAFEFGAEFSGEGHVTVNSDRTMVDAAKGKGGFITELGNHDLGEALVAEIYTFPTSTSKVEGEVHVSVDAEVTDENCGQRIEAQTLEVRGGGAMKVQDLTLPIPSCDAVGDFLVLQNLLQDLKVARN